MLTKVIFVGLAGLLHLAFTGAFRLLLPSLSARGSTSSSSSVSTISSMCTGCMLQAQHQLIRCYDLFSRGMYPSLISMLPVCTVLMSKQWTTVSKSTNVPKPRGRTCNIYPGRYSMSGSSCTTFVYEVQSELEKKIQICASDRGLMSGQ